MLPRVMDGALGGSQGHVLSRNGATWWLQDKASKRRHVMSALLAPSLEA